MRSYVWQSIRAVTACVLAMIFAGPQNLVAQAHVVSMGELQKQAVAASQARQKNIEIVTNFLSTPSAEKAIKSIHADPRQVKTAITNLNDEELAQIANRAQKAQADFVAGSLSDRDLIIILIAIVALILIIVAVR